MFGLIIAKPVALNYLYDALFTSKFASEVINIWDYITMMFSVADLL